MVCTAPHPALHKPTSEAHHNTHNDARQHCWCSGAETKAEKPASSLTAEEGGKEQEAVKCLSCIVLSHTTGVTYTAGLSTAQLSVICLHLFIIDGCILVTQEKPCMVHMMVTVFCSIAAAAAAALLCLLTACSSCC